jgi:tRNA (guanine-N7-)-methyltransferase
VGAIVDTHVFGVYHGCWNDQARTIFRHMSDLAERTLSEVEALQRFVIPWAQLDWPADWDRQFGGPGPLGVEIGFGNGDFLLDQAEKRPDVRFVGIERGWGSVHRALKRLRRAGLQNIRIVQADAAFAVDKLFDSESLDLVFINFPDPWPKERHHSRRLVQPAFVEMLAHRVTPEGEVLIATDHPDLAQWIIEVIQGQDLLEPATDTLWVDHIPDRTPTKYERKAVGAGTPIRYFQLRRRAFQTRPVPIDKVDVVPNVILTGEFEVGGLFADLGEQVWQFGDRDAVVKVRGVYEDQSAGHRLVEVMVKEGSFSQIFGISALLRPEGGLLIKLSPLGHPRPTWGVKQAVLKVAQAALAGCPELRMESSTIREHDQ